MTDKVRDYIYLDVDRLKSIYSQLSGGLVERITVGSSEHEHNFQREGRQFSKSELERQLFLGSGKTETRTLHDYLLTEVEAKLENAILDATNLGFEDIGPGTFIRVAGIAEIDDSERMMTFAGNYNKFFASVLMAPHASELQEKIWDLQDQAAEEVSKKGQERILREMYKFSPEAFIRKGKFGIPDLTVDLLKLYYQHIYENVFEIKIINDFDIVFRMILDKKYLRERPELIYAKYGSRTQVSWTSIAQVTDILAPDQVGGQADMQEAVMDYLNNQGIDIAFDQTEYSEQEQDDGDAAIDSYNSKRSEEVSRGVSGMRDAIENVFGSVHEFEKHARVSHHRSTVVGTPLAIFHEFRTS